MDRVAQCIERACNRAGVPADEVTRKTANEAKKTQDVETLASTAARHAMYLATDNIGYEDVARDLYLLIVSLSASTTLEDVIQRVGPDTFANDYIDFVENHRAELANLLAQGAADKRDRLFKTPGLTVIMRSYMLKDATTGQLAESPQLMWMRVAIGVSQTIQDVEENYTMLSNHYFTHASPTLFNAGKKRCQMSSCFVIECSKDIEGFLKAQYQAGTISRHAGGIGMAVHGTSHKGKVMPILQAFEKTMHLAEQNGGSRNGRMCVYAEPQAEYVYNEMLNAHKNSGADTDKAHDTFTALWVSDEFMRRVEAEQQWTLIDDNAYLIELSHLHGAAFEARYKEMEQEPRFKKVSAVDYFHRILATQVETGRPFLLYKDHANRKSNHQHLGTIRGSNLCTEIIQYFDEEHTAVCNLASLVLFRFIDGEGKFNFGKLRTTVHRLVKNMNNVIDANFYPTEESRKSNMHTRAIGLGVQGLADVFLMMGLPWDSPQAAQLDKRIFETIYFAALEESARLAKAHGHCPAHRGSPAANGQLSHDLWGLTPEDLVTNDELPWADLHAAIARHGLRNSLVTAIMPTASTSIIMGSSSESIEPVYSHLFQRKIMTGESICLNPHLYKALHARGLWTPKMLASIIEHNGLLNDIPEVPEDIKALFRTVWEIPLRKQIELSAARAPFVDQSQSTNVHMKTPTVNNLATYHMLTWKAGLKTSMYYLRQQPKQRATQFAVCKREDPDCVMCSA